MLINIPGVTLIKFPIHSTPCLNQFGKYKFSLVILGLYQMGKTLTDCYSRSILSHKFTHAWRTSFQKSFVIFLLGVCTINIQISLFFSLEI